jgi:hypothetical protein
MNSWDILPITLPKHPEQLVQDAFFVKSKIKETVEQLLTKDSINLFQWLYQIDVSEEKVKTLLKDCPEQETFINQLTEIIFDRLLLKIKIRNLYS